MRLLLSTISIFILTTSQLNADSTSSTKTTEQLVAEFLEAQRRAEKAKAKTDAIMRLGKTVDEVAKELGIEDEQKESR